MKKQKRKEKKNKRISVIKWKYNFHITFIIVFFIGVGYLTYFLHNNPKAFSSDGQSNFFH